ncbi:MAG: bifunctional 3,4-dihydroxy-2-butanone-4-phosphate synthase/GTP cyclohydrolase II [Candidatus Kerfeldbacteria bacterium]|nr:bifunctional 3,4-dihydroxy-2-butanone-4-phosphate synthase/GTP cyclohydrolase II [Candidatus Kerfeldbacteria bacterium]
MPITHHTAFHSITQAIQAVRRGRPVIIVDDANRENEGDIMVAASRARPQLINFMAQHARGLICVALPQARLQALQLPPMVKVNTDPFSTDFSVSVDARHGVSTGISAFDRAHTIAVLINPKTRPHDLVRPGHIFPLRAKTGGVLERAGHTEAAVDLARLAELPAAGVTCEIMNPNGTMARLPQLRRLARQHRFAIISIADLIAYRTQTDQLVQLVAQASLPTQFGPWTMMAFESQSDHSQPIALIKGDIYAKKNVLVRVHSECLSGDVFGSHRCDCGEQLHYAMKYIAKRGNGVIVYLRQEGRGIGLVNKLHAYVLQDSGLDTVQANVCLGFPADTRDYGTAAQILSSIGLKTIQLLTNNPKKVIGLSGHGLRITKHLPLQVPTRPENLHYLRTKRKKLGHWLNV